MSIKKNSLIAIVACVIMVILSTGSANARLSELASAAGTSSPHLGEEIVISALDNQQYYPSVAYNSKHDEYLVVWRNGWGGSSDIYAQRVTGHGKLLSWFVVGPTAPLHPYPNDRFSPSVAYDPVNDRYLVVWMYDTSGNGTNYDIHGVFVNWNGPIAGQHEFKICDWSTIQLNPEVAYARTEEEFMIIWETNHPTLPSYISGRRMKASDGTFNSSGSDFTIDNVSQDLLFPQIAYNLTRNEYLVVYFNGLDILGTRFTGKGAALAGGEFTIAGWPGAETYPSVAACRETDQYLVAWQNDQPDIYARFIKGDGAFDGGPLHMAFTSIHEVLPQVACNAAGSQFVVVWQQQFSNATGPYGIRGQFVNTDKTLGTDFGIMSPTGGVTAQFTLPAVAGGKVNFLTVWEHDRAGTTYQDIHGRLITPYSVFLPLLVRNH